MLCLATCGNSISQICLRASYVLASASQMLEWPRLCPGQMAASALSTLLQTHKMRALLLSEGEMSLWCGVGTSFRRVSHATELVAAIRNALLVTVTGGTIQRL